MKLVAGDWWDWRGGGGGDGGRRGGDGDAFGSCVVRAWGVDGVREGTKTKPTKNPSATLLSSFLHLSSKYEPFFLPLTHSNFCLLYTSPSPRD